MNVLLIINISWKLTRPLENKEDAAETASTQQFFYVTFFDATIHFCECHNSVHTFHAFFYLPMRHETLLVNNNMALSCGLR